VKLRKTEAIHPTFRGTIRGNTGELSRDKSGR
jgi:hypothetical protein